MSSEEPRHVSLIKEAAGDGDLGQRPVTVEHHSARALEAVRTNEGGRRHIEGPAKCVGEMRRTEARYSGEIGDTRRVLDIVADVSE